MATTTFETKNGGLEPDLGGHFFIRHKTRGDWVGIRLYRAKIPERDDGGTGLTDLNLVDDTRLVGSTPRWVYPRRLWVYLTLQIFFSLMAVDNRITQAMHVY